MVNKVLADNLKRILTDIDEAAHTYHRHAQDIILLAVSKTQTIDAIKALYDLGVRHFGENQLQEALPKIKALKHLDITWHFIGRIQSNKTKLIAEHFSWVHSIGDVRHAKRLHAARSEDLPPLNICIQFNVSQEKTKAGVSAEALLPLAATIQHLTHLKLRGLMSLPAPCENNQLQRQTFAKVRDAFHVLTKCYPEMDTLSMGMSDDYVAAIAEGATLIRIGRALFKSL